MRQSLEELDEDETLEQLDDDGAVVAVDLLTNGAFTVNWLPVTTVTSAPSVTWLGSLPMGDRRRDLVSR